MNDATNEAPAVEAATPPAIEPTDAMVDLETVGKKPYCPILSIGAVALRLDREHPISDSDMFYVPITLSSCLAAGLRVDGDTLVWWMGQDSAMQQAAFCDPTAVPLAEALDRFTDWLQSRPLQLWGNSARFDMGILEAAYDVLGKQAPWRFYDERCYRTVKNLPAARDIPLVRTGPAHHALHDAVSQAIHLRQINLALQLHL